MANIEIPVCQHPGQGWKDRCLQKGVWFWVLLAQTSHIGLLAKLRLDKTWCIRAILPFSWIYDIFGYSHGDLMPPPSIFQKWWCFVNHGWIHLSPMFPHRRDVFAARYLQSFWRPWRPCHRWGKEHETGEYHRVMGVWLAMTPRYAWRAWNDKEQGRYQGVFIRILGNLGELPMALGLPKGLILWFSPKTCR